VSIYGLVADPADVRAQLSSFLEAAPTDARRLVTEQLGAITKSSSGGLGVGVVVGIAAAVWTASSGIKALITGINVAYDETETRSFVALRARALVLTLLGVASLTRSALHGRLPIGGDDEYESISPGPGAQHVDEHDVITVLRRLVAAEVVIAILVVAVTSLLVDANPSAALAARGGPFDQTHVVNDALINVVVVPGTVGPTDIHLYVDNPAGGLSQPVGVTATLSLPSGGVTGIDIPFVNAGPKHWTANDVDVPISGTWQLKVEVLLTDIDKATTTFNVPIGGSS